MSAHQYNIRCRWFFFFPTDANNTRNITISYLLGTDKRIYSSQAIIIHINAKHVTFRWMIRDTLKIINTTIYYDICQWQVYECSSDRMYYRRYITVIPTPDPVCATDCVPLYIQRHNIIFVGQCTCEYPCVVKS